VEGLLPWGILGIAFLLTLALIRLALAVAQYFDRRNGHG
jgi:hypothetical protein